MFDCYNRRINYLRVSVTDRCNLRCRYCMPRDGISLVSAADILSLEEIHSAVNVAVALGVTKVKLTGGEPLVRKGVVQLVQWLSQNDGISDLSMTTNGTLLGDYAASLKAAGLGRVNISLDTLDPQKYQAITRVGDLAKAISGIETAVDVFEGRVKLNCVVQKTVDEADAKAVKNFAEQKRIPVRFIPQMDTQEGVFSRVIGGDGGNCTDCNRIRLTCTGDVFPCLFSNACFNVRQLGAKAAILKAVEAKPKLGHASDHHLFSIGG